MSIHAPREGSDGGDVVLLHNVVISIHAPREGSDLMLCKLEKGQLLFQSTLPARGATYNIKQFSYWQRISIHAPREGSDADY